MPFLTILVERHLGQRIILSYHILSLQSILKGLDKSQVMCYDKIMDIRGLRKQLGLTAEELAQKLGVSVGTVSRWETGKNKPSRLAKRRLKDVLDKEVT